MPETTQIDPVCGTEVDADTAAAWEFGGTIYSFCSVTCLEDFKEDPDSYLS